MEPVIGLDGSVATECPSLSAPIWQDVLAQAMTGELMAAMNHTSLSKICDDPEEKAEALEHAQNELGHAARFAREGRKIGVDVVDSAGRSEDVRDGGPRHPEIDVADCGSDGGRGLRVRPMSGAAGETRTAQRAQRGAAPQACGGIGIGWS